MNQNQKRLRSTLMADRNPGNAIAEYGLCGALIAIIALSALAGLGLSLGAKFQSMGAEIGALATGQSGQLPTTPKAPAVLQPLTGQTGSGGSVTGSLPSGLSTLSPDTAVHAPVTDTTGANGTTGHTTTEPLNPDTIISPSQPITEPGGNDSSRPRDNMTTIQIEMPVDKTQVGP